MHLARLIDWLYAHGGRKLDFTVGGEDYKAEWTDGAEMPVTGLTRLSGRRPTARRGLAQTLRRLRVGLTLRAQPATACQPARREMDQPSWGWFRLAMNWSNSA